MVQLILNIRDCFYQIVIDYVNGLNRYIFYFSLTTFVNPGTWRHLLDWHLLVAFCLINVASLLFFVWPFIEISKKVFSRSIFMVLLDRLLILLTVLAPLSGYALVTGIVILILAYFIIKENSWPW